jgi:PIN domain nuclease of toxin-antitoxin system
VFGYAIAPDSAVIPEKYVPLYRVFSEVLNRHICTIDVNEYNNLDKDPPPEDLNLAINPYLDPSSGNRATSIAKYGISNGVELDLSKSEGITVEDQTTTSQSEYWEVTETTGIGTGFSLFFNAISMGIQGSHSTGEFVRTSIHQSAENVIGKVKTALCKLVRNQNVADLYDIEIYWDKQFSTFMFRKVMTGIKFAWIDGVAFSERERVRNIDVFLLDVNAIIQESPLLFQDIFEILRIRPDVDPLPDTDVFIDKIIDIKYDIDDIIDRIPSKFINSTVSDHMGHYSLKNIELGTYLLKAGNILHKVTISKSDLQNSYPKTVDLENVKRIFNPEKAALWELIEILDINLHQARRIQLKLQKFNIINQRVFEGVLKSEKVSVEKFRKLAIFKNSPKTPFRDRLILQGRIDDLNKEGLENIDVYLIGTKFLEENHPDFLEDWHSYDISEFIKNLPSETYYDAMTNFLGKYWIRNVNPEHYHLLTSDKLTPIDLRKEDFDRKIVNVENVKRRIDLSIASAWELRNAFKIPLFKAKNIEKAIKSKRLTDTTEIQKVLIRENIDIEGFRKKMDLDFKRPNRRNKNRTISKGA